MSVESEPGISSSTQDTRQAISLSLSSLCFSGGQEVLLEEDTILVIVGPNNAGKSRALRDIHNSFGSAHTPCVITKVEFSTSGNSDDFSEWIKGRLLRTERHKYEGIGGTVDRDDIKRWPSRPLPRSIINHLCILATAAQRFELLRKPAPLINPLRDPERHPLHFLLTYEHAESGLSDLVARAFGVEMILNRGAGENLQIHCGTRPAYSDSVGLDYLRALDDVPTLDEQGDGLKSFFACLVQVLLGSWKLVLLDEPEMFLHPPQAELLGEILARDVPLGRQLVIATHSSDLLRGMLKHAASRIKLVRIVRRDDVNDVSELPPDGVVSLWRDPSLRFTNALDSLFHESIVVCESDADCRFYDAVLEAIKPDQIRPMFAPAGGKQALKKLIATLRALGVPCSAVADFDILNDKNVLCDLWEAAGGTWSSIEADWKAIRDGIETDSTVPHRGKVLDEVRNLLKGKSSAERITEIEGDKIREIAKSASGWSRAKTAGLAALPQGAAAEAGKKLLETLAGRNIHVVPVGELERFAPTIGGKSGGWITTVLDSFDLQSDPSLAKARQFVSSLPPRLSSRNSQDLTSRRESPLLGKRIRRRISDIYQGDSNSYLSKSDRIWISILIMAIIGPQLVLFLIRLLR